MKKRSEKTTRIYKIIIVLLVFWILDFVMHYTGVGESNYYYLSKLGNGLLFATMWFFIFDSKKLWPKVVYSFVFGTWVSFYYLVSSYSGLIQMLGVYARYTPPPFVIGGIFLTPYLWWLYHATAFFLGLIVSGLIFDKKK